MVADRTSRERHGIGHDTSDTDDLPYPPKRALKSRTGLSPLDPAQAFETTWTTAHYSSSSCAYSDFPHYATASNT